MKKFIFFSVVLLPLTNLYAVKEDWKKAFCEPFSIVSRDAVLPVGKYKKGFPVFELGWRSNGKLFDGGQLNVNIVDPITYSERKGKKEEGGYTKLRTEHPDGELIAVRADDDNKTVLILDKATGELRAEFKHDGTIQGICWSPGGGLIAVGGGCSMTIKSVIPLLLATHQLHDPTPSQFLLLNKLRERLLKEKKSLRIEPSDKKTLDEMPDIEKLLRVEKGGSKKNPLWQVRLKQAAKQKKWLPHSDPWGER